MLVKTCPQCGSKELVSNGHDVMANKSIIEPHLKVSVQAKLAVNMARWRLHLAYCEERKQEIIRAYFE